MVVVMTDNLEAWAGTRWMGGTEREKHRLRKGGKLQQESSKNFTNPERQERVKTLGGAAAWVMRGVRTLRSVTGTGVACRGFRVPLPTLGPGDVRCPGLAVAMTVVGVEDKEKAGWERGSGWPIGRSSTKCSFYSAVQVREVTLHVCVG